jgi:hypothetical protein
LTLVCFFLDDIEEDVDKKAAWWLKAFLFGTALYAGCYFLPLMGMHAMFS